MNPVSVMLVAYACVAPLEPAPDFNMTVAFKCAPPRVESAAKAKPAVPKAKPRKSRLAQLNPNVPGWVLRRKHRCGGETPDWYQKNSAWRYKCR